MVRRTNAAAAATCSNISTGLASDSSERAPSITSSSAPLDVDLDDARHQVTHLGIKR